MFTRIRTRSKLRRAARMEANVRIDALIKKINKGFIDGNINASVQTVNFDGTIVVQGKITIEEANLIKEFLADSIKDVKFYGANEDPEAS